MRTHKKNVLYVSDLPLANSLYSSGYVIAILEEISLSNTSEKTGSMV